MHTRHILFLSAIGAALLLGQGFVINFVQAFPTLVKTDSEAVRDGAKVTVRFQITLRDNPTTLEQRMAGMQPGGAKTFPLSAEEGFGSYYETKIQTIPTAAL